MTNRLALGARAPCRKKGKEIDDVDEAVGTGARDAEEPGSNEKTHG